MAILLILKNGKRWRYHCPSRIYIHICIHTCAVKLKETPDFRGPQAEKERKADFKDKHWVFSSKNNFEGHLTFLKLKNGVKHCLSVNFAHAIWCFLVNFKLVLVQFKTCLFLIYWAASIRHPMWKLSATTSRKFGQKLSHHVMPKVLVLKAQGRHVMWWSLAFWAHILAGKYHITWWMFYRFVVVRMQLKQWNETMGSSEIFFARNFCSRMASVMSLGQSCR